MFRQIGPTEILLIIALVLLLFGGRKLPELARGTGKALKIFKSEVRDTDEIETKKDTTATDPQQPLEGEIVDERHDLK